MSDICVSQFEKEIAVCRTGDLTFNGFDIHLTFNGPQCPQVLLTANQIDPFCGFSSAFPNLIKKEVQM